MVEIKRFGIAKEIISNDASKIDVDGMTVKELKERLYNDFPELKQVVGFMLAINQEYGTDDQVLSNTDEIAIIPPVSGG